jgi:hypothetical protein
MRTMGQCIGFLLLGAALAAPLASGGCAARVATVYDAPHHDWHTWDDAERQAYRRYWDEKHEPFRPYGNLTQEEENAYWNWRHGETHAADPH